jgi:nucleotide-binding universal stress UspA family protein
MARRGKICCPIDFSELSMGALVEAARIASAEDAPLTIVHVYEAPAPVASGTALRPGPRETDQDLERFKAAAEAIAPRRVAAEPLSGEPGAEIVRFAEREGVDLVVMATHGRTGMKRLALGSVAEHVVRHAPCSVLVVKGR